MNLQNTPWDYQEHDRIISILAWVVVVVLVIYASVFFYKQITTTGSDRPPKEQLPVAPVATPTTNPDEAATPESVEANSTPEPVKPATTPKPMEIAKIVPTPEPVKPVAPPRPVHVVEPPKPAAEVKPPVAEVRPPPVKPEPVKATPPVEPPPRIVEPVEPPKPVAATPAVEPAKPPPAETRPVRPVAPALPRGERMTLKIGKFASAGEAVRTGVELGIDGHSFTPVRDPLTNRYTLHFGEFTGWKDAIAVMDAIKAKNSTLDVRVWPIPSSQNDSVAGEDEGSGPAPSTPAPAPAAAEKPPKPAPVKAAPAKPASVRKAAAAPAPAEEAPAEETQAGETAPAESAAPTPPAGPYVVRVASYKVLDNAKSAISSLKSAGFRATLDKTTVRGALWYRVHVGGFKTSEEAKRALPKIEHISHVSSGSTVIKL